MRYEPTGHELNEIAGMVASADARLRVVGQVLYDMPDGVMPSEDAVDAAVLAAARVLSGAGHG